MRRKITLFLIVIVCFLLQTTLFKKLAFANIAPNLLVIVISSFGFMRGRKEGLFLGFFSGLLIDIFFGQYLGVYALLYMYIGYVNGIFQKKFYPEDLKLPMVLIGVSDITCNLLIYMVSFLTRAQFAFGYYVKAVILPEFIYTMIVTIFVYYILLKINQRLERLEKRSSKDFEL